MFNLEQKHAILLPPGSRVVKYIVNHVLTGVVLSVLEIVNGSPSTLCNRFFDIPYIPIIKGEQVDGVLFG
jgi:hypothetical protein